MSSASDSDRNKISYQFDGAAVLDLLQHSLSYDYHYPLPSALPVAEVQEIGRHKEIGRTGPGLWLVVKNGVYLQSNAYPDRGFPVFAEAGEPCGVDRGEVIEFLPTTLEVFKHLGPQDRLVATFAPPSNTCRLTILTSRKRAGELLERAQKSRVPDPEQP